MNDLYSSKRFLNVEGIFRLNMHNTKDLKLDEGRDKGWVHSSKVIKTLWYKPGGFRFAAR
jgi:hypothetical protein